MSICTVGDGKSYPSLYAAHAASFGLASKTLSEPLTVLCYPFSGGDTTGLVLTGWTTTATNTITIKTPDGYKHGGKWDDSVYKICNNSPLDIRANNVVIEGLQVDHIATGNYYNGVAVSYANTGIIFRDLIVRLTPGAYTGHRGIYVANASASVNVVCCLVYNYTTGNSFIAVNNPSVCFYNCTAYNSAKGFYGSGENAYVKNCLAQNCTDGFYRTFNSGSTNNCSDISGDAPGTNAITGSVGFVDAANEDFHVASTDTIVNGAGADLSSDAAFPFSTDIDGDTITSWSIGADAQVSSAGDSFQTLSTNIFWSIKTINLKNTSWKLLTDIQSEIFWKLINKKEQNSFWKVLIDASEFTSWKIYKKLSFPSFWRIINESYFNIFWKLFNLTDNISTWKLLTKNSIETSWKIQIENNQSFTWKILNKLSVNTFWAIFNGGYLSCPITWTIKNEKQEEIFWKIINRNNIDSDWIILKLNSVNLSWKVLYKLYQNTNWIILNKDQIRLLWNIGNIELLNTNDDRIFSISLDNRMAFIPLESRLVAINIESKTLVLIS